MDVQAIGVPTAKPVLEIKGLRAGYSNSQEVVKGVDIFVQRGTCLGIVGESGSGKSTTLLGLLGLLVSPGGSRVIELRFNGRPVGGGTLHEFLGKDVGVVFQNPMSALNPVMRVGEQIAEGMGRHLGVSKRTAAARAVQLMESVGILNSESVSKWYPHQLSGGMRQRVMVAIALSCQPTLLVADEPTSSLDVTMQSQLLQLIEGARVERDLAVIIVTHDLAVVAEVADRVAIMYAGNIVEEGNTRDILTSPKHPYTRGLLASIPDPDRKGMLQPIPGIAPQTGEDVDGCSFEPRCPHSIPICRLAAPELERDNGQGSARRVACWLYADEPSAKKEVLDRDEHSPNRAG